MGSDNTYGETNFNPDNGQELQRQLDEDYRVESGNTAYSCFSLIVFLVVIFLAGLIVAWKLDFIIGYLVSVAVLTFVSAVAFFIRAGTRYRKESEGEVKL